MKPADSTSTTPSSGTPAAGMTASGATAPGTPAPRRGRARRWTIRLLKTLGIILAVILLIPVLLYVPPIQRGVVALASRMVEKSTGMKIEIGDFRLRFPLDVVLKDVVVIPAPGDTMVQAREAIADVKLAPLLDLDVRINRLDLMQAKLRILSKDSSMDMRVVAGRLTVGERSAANLRTGTISLHDAYLRDGSISLYMDVWKKKPEPSEPTDMKILADRLRLENFSFAMSMLPTIDTLTFFSRDLELQKASIDLLNSRVTAASLTGADGKVVYLTPTPEYVASHPAPVDTVSPPSPPMVITADTIGLSGYDVLYAVAGAKPLPGFDPSYIQLSGLNIGVAGFRNAAVDITLPVRSLSGRERSGLEITSGSGTFSMDSLGMALKDFDIATPFSSIQASALIPNALLELQPGARIDVSADASLGPADILAFMPDLKPYSALLGSKPMRLALRAEGRLDDVDVSRLDLAMPGLLSLRASGRATDPLDPKLLCGKLTLDGELTGPGAIQKAAGLTGFRLPTMKLKGTATARRQTYGADFSLATPDGDLAAKGSVGLDSEHYEADLRFDDIDVEAFLPDMGIGLVSGSLQARGAGFNPEAKGAATDIRAFLDLLQYNYKTLRDIRADIQLHDGAFSLDLNSPNPDADLTLAAVGTLAPDLYGFDVDADVRNLNLEALGLSPTPNGGSIRGRIKGTASPKRWNYDLALDLTSLSWTVGEAAYDLPDLRGTLRADAISTSCHLQSRGMEVDFSAPQGMEGLMAAFSKATEGLDKQVAARNVDFTRLENLLPRFHLDARLSGAGGSMLSNLLGPSGMAVDTLWATLGKDSLISGRIGALSLNTGTMTIDTLGLDLQQRGELLDYHFHMGNRPGPLGEFADVNFNGYLATNRASIYATQRNEKGEEGYRLGLTAALTDSLVSLHFTPLKATIAYLPWRFNLDNHVDYNLRSMRLDADLQANSAESSILLRTEELPDGGGQQLHLNLKDIHLQDFLNMRMEATPMTATLNSDILLHYTGHSLEGTGKLSATGLSYDNVRIDDLDLGINAGLDPRGDSKVSAILKAAGQDALTATLLLANDGQQGMEAREMDLTFDGFPLALANPFLGADMVSLSGKLRGKCDVTVTPEKRLRLNGDIRFDTVGINIPMMGTTLRLDNDPVPVIDNIITLDNFNILAANANPLTLNGTVDATRLADVKFNLLANASNFQLVGTKPGARSDLTGKLFLDLDAKARGSLEVMDIQANVSVLGTTDVTYTISDAAAQLGANKAEGLVKFVNLTDSTQVAMADTLRAPTTAMRISAALNVNPGTEVTVNLNSTGSNKVTLQPTANLSLYQNYMGDMKLTGVFTTGQGMVRYNIPVIGTKNFQFEPQSHATWTGDLMNPQLSIKAWDPVKANISTGGQANLVDFDVWLLISGNLSQPQVLFDLTTDNDLTVSNELQGMTPDQRSTTAMNLLLTGQYTGSGAKTLNSSFGTSTLYSFLTSQINSWAAQTIKGVDLSFGVDQYQTGLADNTSTATSYSYQMSKSLFDNRFKIVVGGNYTTDANADEDFAQNLISDIAFEYVIKQSANYSVVGRLFRHTGFESVLEGEITETGLGLAYRRRLNNLRSFFRLRPKKRSAADTVAAQPPQAPPAAPTNDNAEPEGPETNSAEKHQAVEQAEEKPAQVAPKQTGNE